MAVKLVLKELSNEKMLSKEKTEFWNTSLLRGQQQCHALAERVGIFFSVAFNPEIMNSSSYRSQATQRSRTQVPIGARVVGTGMQIPFEGTSLLKEAENVDLSDISCFLGIVKLRKTYKFRSMSWFLTYAK